MPSSLGSGGIWSDGTRSVIHFGSPQGSEFGVRADVQDFQERHPDFIVPGRSLTSEEDAGTLEV